MSISLITEVFERSRSTGSARLVLLVLAEHVNEQRYLNTGWAEAWPGQLRIAERAGLGAGITTDDTDKRKSYMRRSVRRQLKALKDLGEIEFSRSLKDGRVAWGITLPDEDAPVPGDSAVPWDNLVHEGGQELPPPGTAVHPPPGTGVSHKPEGEPEELEPEHEHGSGPSAADARTTHYVDDPDVVVFDQERISVETVLTEPDLTPFDERVERAIARLVELDEEEATMDMWARRLIPSLSDEGQGIRELVVA